MAHPEMEAVEVTDVSSAAAALSQMDGIFGDDEERKEDPPETDQQDPAEDEDIAPDEADKAPEASDESDGETREDEQDAELEEEAIQAPVSWSSDKKDLFAKLSPEAQEYIHLRESQRDKGFQEKSTEIAELKKSLDAEKQAVKQERLRYAESLAAQVNQALPEKPGVDLLNPNSPEYNPEQYHLQKAQYDEAKTHQESLKSEYVTKMQQQQEEQQREFQSFVNEQNEILRQELPEWSQDGFKDKILSYATDKGYVPEQLQNASALDIHTLTKAMKYDELMARKPGVKEKVRTVPKVARPGAKQGQSAKYEARQARLKNLRSSGSLDDAAAVLGDLL